MVVTVTPLPFRSGCPIGKQFEVLKQSLPTVKKGSASCETRGRDAAPRSLRMTRSPIAFAHRGARQERPENSIAAFERALELGATGLETDAWLSSDGEVVLVHDSAVRRGLRRHRVNRTPATELAALGIPRLADLYDACGHDFELSIDCKVDEVAEPIVEVASTLGDLRRVWLCHPNAEFLETVRARTAEPRLIVSTWRKNLPGSFERHVADLATAGIDGINLHHTEWTAGLVAMVHRFERTAFAWDVQEVRHMRAVLKMRIDGFYADDVTRMMSVVGEWA